MQQSFEIEVPPDCIKFFKHTKISCFKNEILGLIFVQVILLMIQLDFKTAKKQWHPS